MTKYKVTLSRCVVETYEVEAEDEEQALDIANEWFDEANFRGHELYDDNQTNEVKIIEDDNDDDENYNDEDEEID